MIKTQQAKTSRRMDAVGRKSARLEARITLEQKATIERAAAYEGRSVTDFVVHAVSQAAKAVVQEHEVWRLSPAQSVAFVRGLLATGEPNRALRTAAKKYGRSVTAR